MEIIQAIGKYIIVEPQSESTVLKATKTATIFKVLYVGDGCEVYKGKPGDLIIVAESSVSLEKAWILNKEINFIRETDIVAVVKDGKS